MAYKSIKGAGTTNLISIPWKLQNHSKTKQNHIDNHFLQFDFLLKTCKPSMWDPD